MSRGNVDELSTSQRTWLSIGLGLAWGGVFSRGRGSFFCERRLVNRTSSPQATVVDAHATPHNYRRYRTVGKIRQHVEDRYI